MNAKTQLWVPGDWNAFFGFGTNILVNLLTLTALLRFVLKMPDSLVFGRILPATGLMMCLSTFYYAFLAYRLAKKTGRTDVCALPSGISVPHMFIVTFVVMLPIALTTKDPIKGWEAGLTWVFVQSFVLMVGGFVGPIIRKVTPRAALLGTLACVSLTFHGAGLADVHDPGDRRHLFRHHSFELVRRSEIREGSGGPGVSRSQPMSESRGKLGRKKDDAIAALLSQRSIDEAARSINVTPRTLYRWMKEPQFEASYRQVRRTAFSQSIARLQQASSAAAATFLKLMVDPNAPAAVKLRAADLVFTHGAKAIEIEDIEVRVRELERAAETSKHSKRDR